MLLKTQPKNLFFANLLVDGRKINKILIVNMMIRGGK